MSENLIKPLMYQDEAKDKDGNKAIPLMDVELSKKVAEKLNDHYPGHAWGVTASVDQGIVTIRNFALTDKHGFIVLIDKLKNDPGMKLIVNAGGEFLERYNIKRGAGPYHHKLY